jgi:hypothetical protein
VKNEQQSEPTTTTAPATETTPTDSWGQSLRTERLEELEGYLDRWQAETDHGERKGPFDKDEWQAQTKAELIAAT